MVGRKKETGSGGEDERAEDHVEEPEDKEGMVTCTKTTSPATFREFSARPKSSEENELASYVSNRISHDFSIIYQFVSFVSVSWLLPLHSFNWIDFERFFLCAHSCRTLPSTAS